jgi:hypothetical protein
VPTQQIGAEAMPALETIQFELDNDTLLVLFEFFAKEIDERNGSRLKPITNDESELWAMNRLYGVLERTLHEPFRKDYLALLSLAQKSLSERCGPWPD